jgi:hypothetical protein
MERPIIFSTDMVKAILEGRKTQTRRVTGLWQINLWPDDWQWAKDTNRKILTAQRTGERIAINDTEIGRPWSLMCPYGQVGDKLWVRETFWVDDELPADLPVYIHYRADPHLEVIEKSIKWRPSIHMPRWASRITLEITGIRVERLQEITEEDARAEGVELILWEPDDATNKALARLGAEQVTKPYPVGWRNYLRKFDGRYRYGQPKMYPDMVDSARASFFSLWDSINAKRGYGWSSNPWVWVISFKMLKDKDEGR